MEANFTMRTSLGTFWSLGLVFRVSSDKEQLGDLILNEVIAAMISNTVFVSEDHFTPIVFTMVMSEVFDFAALKSAAFTRIKMKDVVLPSIIGHPLSNDFRQEHGLARHGGHG